MPYLVWPTGVILDHTGAPEAASSRCGSRRPECRATRCLVLTRSSAAKAVVFSVSFLIVSQARADVSSWLFLGGGTNLVKTPVTGYDVVPSMRLATGMGSDPAKPWAVGGLVRIETLFGRGSDLSAVLRVADSGFVNGNWGLALDVGPFARYWGTPNVYGATGTVVLGGPWGLELELGGLLGNHEIRGLSATLGIDLARLTVYRQSGSSWWKNSFPAVRPEANQ
jgi:hypothetical protein